VGVSSNWEFRHSFRESYGRVHPPEGYGTSQADDMDAPETRR
jgi:hypothetical protein